MNTGLEFRVWDGERMTDDFAIRNGIAMREADPVGECEVIAEDGTRSYSDWAKYEPINKAVIMQRVGLRDIRGRKIWVGDRLRFLRSPADTKGIHTGIWEGVVEMEDGVFTVSILDIVNVENPATWDQPHDWVKSRWWGTTVGYGVDGPWNCHRKSLADIHTGFGNEYEAFLKPLYEKYTHSGGRIINVEVVGNIYEGKEDGLSS